jgi:glycerate-2-kinase
MLDPRQFLLDLATGAIDAARPEGSFDGRLPEPPRGRTIVVGAGKAAASMAAAFEKVWPHPLEGLVVTRYGHGCPTGRIRVVEASHPVPDENGLKAAADILALARSAGPDDLVVALISGGASALLSLPAEGIAFAEKQAINRALLKSGAAIHDMNTVRRALSAVKGGRLAAASRAPVVTYVISDVPGDDPAVIGSGPTVVSPDGPEEALAVLRRFGVDIPEGVRAAMLRNAPAAFTPGPVHLLASGRTVLDLAAEKARAAGLAVLDLGDAIEGEAREVAKVIAGVARSVRASGVPVKAPALILSGGETTVTVRGNGRGGRNAEFLLGLVLALDGAAGIHAVAVDTDGIDGVEDAAGAVAGPETLARARSAGMDAAAHLADNDAYGFFSALGELAVTGPTLTNVNDFRAVLVL